MEQIIGNTVEQKSQLSIGDHFAYAAGSTVVYYSYQKNQQMKFFIGQAQVNAVLISRDGSHIFTGEQSFKNPAVNVFKLDNQLPYQLSGHKLGIQQLLESPSQTYLFSLGTEQDKHLILWNWKDKKKLASNKLSKQVYSIQFNPKGTILVSAGQGHLKYWLFASDGKALCDDKTLQPRSFTLHEQFALKTFVDCVVKERLYTITQDGLMCLFSLQTKSMVQWINLNVENIFSLAHNDQYVICSGSSSTIRVFNNQLQHVVTLPKPSISQNQKIDCIAIEVHNQLLISVYKNRMMILWDISDITSIIKLKVFASHQHGITNLQILKRQSSIDITFFVTITEQQQLGIWHTNNQVQGLKSDCQNTIILKDLKQADYPSAEIQCLNVSIDGKYLALGDCLGFLRIMSLIDFEIISVIKVHQSKINCITFCQTLPIVATGSDDQNIMLFDDKFNPNANLKGHKGPLINVLFVQDLIISCETDKLIIWRQFNNNYKQSSQLVISNCIKQIETDGENLFVIQEKLISVYEVQQLVCKYTIEIDNCVRLILKSFETQQMIILVLKNNVKLLKHQNGQLETIEDFQYSNIQGLDIAADNKQIIMAGVDGCIYFQKLKWQPQQKYPKLIDLFQKNEKNKWIINNFWNEKELRLLFGCDTQDDIGFIKFESESDEEQQDTQAHSDALNSLDQVIQTLGVTFAQEIQSQFQNNMNQVLKSYKEQSVIKSTFKENDGELLRNPFYEEQQNMQEFQRRQSSNILKKMQLRNQKSDQQEVQVEMQQNNNIAIPFPSQISSFKKKFPEFPKFQQIEIKSIISSSISKSPCISNRFKQRFDFPYQNSIILNCSYLPSERKQSEEEQIDSDQQYVNDLKDKLVITIDQSSQMPHKIVDYGNK